MCDKLYIELRKLVERCDGAEGVRSDGSNIDTTAAHAALGDFEDEENLREEQADKAARRGASQWWARCDAITSDLHVLPLVFATGTNMEDLLEQINFWALEEEISENSRLEIQNAVQLAECPSDGMCGTMLTKPINVPELSGMVFHIQLT